MNDQVLRTSLLDLLHHLGNMSLGNMSGGLLLAGGYGLYLKQLNLAAGRHRTLIPVDHWPVPRATQDLDLLLSAQLVADVPSMDAVRECLDAQGYSVVVGSEYLQFSRVVTGSQRVKIDLLTAQLDVLGQYPLIQADARRARPNSKTRPQLHAHPTDGALGLEESSVMIEIEGTLSNGTSTSTRIRIPHPFTYLLMKLTAYRDRRNDQEKDLGRHHALDIFRIIAMMTEGDIAEVRRLINHFASNPQMQSCAALVKSDFVNATSPGLLAMRAHPLWQDNPNRNLFIETLQHLFS